MLEKGDAVIPVGKLKKVVDFLADADKETLRILSSFFEGDAKGATDAKRLKKPCIVAGVYPKEFLIGVEITKGYIWEEKEEYWTKVEVPETSNEN